MASKMSSRDSLISTLIQEITSILAPTLPSEKEPLLDNLPIQKTPVSQKNVKAVFLLNSTGQVSTVAPRPPRPSNEER